MSRSRSLIPGPALLGLVLLLLMLAMGTDRPEPVDPCDLYPEAREPTGCARDHWAN